jgi:anti-sigma B factor antagonist
VETPSLTFHIDRRPDAFRLAVAGDIDLSTVDQLVTQATAILAEAPRQLVLDFAGVAYLDSSGLSGLIKLRALADKTHTRIQIDHARRFVRVVMTTTGLAEVFHVTPNADAADPA